MCPNLLQEIVENRFLLILMEEEEYLIKLEGIIKSAERTKTKICYVCLSKPYVDVLEDLRKRNLDISQFFFIDTLSSHYKKPEKADNCVFVSNPSDLEDIKKAIKKIVEKKGCSVVLFDTISTLLIYQETSSIVRFTHNLISEREHEKTKKLFIVLKEEGIPSEENQRLVKDLGMFADKTIEF